MRVLILLSCVSFACRSEASSPLTGLELRNEMGSEASCPTPHLFRLKTSGSFCPKQALSQHDLPLGGSTTLNLGNQKPGLFVYLFYSLSFATLSGLSETMECIF